MNSSTSHLVTPRGNLTAVLRDLQQQQQALRPLRSPGTLTSVGPGGVKRASLRRARVAAADEGGWVTAVYL